ncbi:MAG: hypothetical protein ACHQEM_03975 [Chitinophagales bacterium]
MRIQRLICGILVCLCSAAVMAQTNNQAHVKKHRFALYAGIGPNYYFNNLVLGKKLVNDWNYSFVGRFMWEPEHFLSVGIESGYYRLYTLNGPDTAHAHIANSAIPIQFVISMKFLKSFYFNFSMGQSKLINKVTADVSGDFNASAWSLADFTCTLGYHYVFKSRISLGAELKYFYSTAFTDRNIALVFMAGYKF